MRTLGPNEKYLICPVSQTLIVYDLNDIVMDQIIGLAIVCPCKYIIPVAMRISEEESRTAYERLGVPSDWASGIRHDLALENAMKEQEDQA